MMARDAERVRRQTIESGKIRQGAAKGAQLLGTSSDLYPTLPTLAPSALPATLETYRQGLNAWPIVQQYLATAGQGGRASMTKPVDQATLDATSKAFYPALRNTQAGALWAIDAAARQGLPVPEWATAVTGLYDPAAFANNLGLPATHPHDFSQAVPGNLVEWARGLGDTPLAAALKGLPPVPGTAPTAEALRTGAQNRSQAAQQVLSTNLGVLGDRTGQAAWGPSQALQGIAAAAPYAQGGLPAVMQSMGLGEYIPRVESGLMDLSQAVALAQQRGQPVNQP
jgi:hypothetical protein